MFIFTADFHLGHQNIIKYCGRPWKTVKDMEDSLIENYNAVVTDDDTVFILGDLTLAGSEYLPTVDRWVRQLKGKKHLILGNHDRIAPFQYMDLGFISVHTGLELFVPGLERKVYLCHDPAWAVTAPDTLFLCGHVHNLFKQVKNALNVGVDVWEYHPVSELTLRKYLTEGQ